MTFGLTVSAARRIVLAAQGFAARSD